MQKSSVRNITIKTISVQSSAGPDGESENHKVIVFLSNTGQDPLENHKATKSAFNVVPSSVRQ